MPRSRRAETAGAPVDDPEPEEAGFEVDPHAGAANSAPEGEEAPQQQAPDDFGALPVTGWTPEEASQLICALWNFGMLIYGPEWAAHPAETAGWNISAAQLLDQVMPRGMGGAVELGAGLLLVGNGLAMMGVRRIPIIQRGPRPMWANRTTRPVATPPAGEPAPAAEDQEGAYKLPPELVPQGSAMDGTGVEL